MAKKKRVYRIDDLAEIAAQLGCRLRVDIIPEEMLRPQPPAAPKDAPEKKKRAAPTSRKQRSA